MGVHGLWQIIDSIGHPIKIEGLEGKRLGVDANVWLYKFIRGFREKDNASSIDSHKLGLFNRISKLLYYKIKPVFVFDGPAPVLKRRTLEKRHNIRNKHVEKIQNNAMKLLAQHIKEQYPSANVDDIEIRAPDLKSHNLVAAEKLTEDDRELFRLPSECTVEREISDSDDSDDSLFTSSYSRPKVDIHSKEFAQLPPEVRYEILHDIKQSRRRGMSPPPDNAESFSNFQLLRLKARRTVQEKIEQCEKDICSTYTGDCDGKVVHTYRMQSDSTSTMLYSSVSSQHDSNKPSQSTDIKPKSTLSLEHKDNVEPTPANHHVGSGPAWLASKPTMLENHQTIRGGHLAKVQNSAMKLISQHFKERCPDDNTDTNTIHTDLKLSPERSPEYLSETDVISDTTDVSDSQPSPQMSQLPRETDDASIDRTEEKIQAHPNRIIELSSAEESDTSPASTVDWDSSADELVLQNDVPLQVNDHHQPLTTSPVSSSDPPKSSQPTTDVSNSQPTTAVSNSQPTTAVSNSQPTANVSNSQPTANVSNSQPPPRMFQFPKDPSVEESKRLTNKVTQKIVDEAKELLRLFGIPYIDAAGEAEAQCALLENLKLTEGTITDDSDVWLFGAQNVYRYFFSDDKYVLQYKMTDIEFHIRMTRENLVCFAMLVGSDYTEGIKNVGPVTALEVLSEFHGDGLEPLLRYKEWKTKCSNTKDRVPASKERSRLLKFDLPGDFPSRAVFEGYTRPMADSSTEQFTWGTPELDELREYARRNFGWEYKKIDEKLLPVLKRLNERKTQTKIDSFFFKRTVNQNPELFRSKRVNAALNKITRASGSQDDVVVLTDEENSDVAEQTQAKSKSKRGPKKSTKAKQTKATSKSPKKKKTESGPIVVTLNDTINLSDDSDTDTEVIARQHNQPL